MLVVDLLHEFELGVWEGCIQASYTSFICCSSSGTPCSRTGLLITIVWWYVFIVVPFLIHIPFVDSIWFPNLDTVQLSNSVPTHPKWRNLPHRAMRIWSLKIWLVYLLTVCHTCIWGTTTWAPQCYCYQAAFSSCWMACTYSQAKVPHRTHNTLAQVHYNGIWKVALWVQDHDMFCISNMWASKRSSCVGWHQVQKQAKVFTTPSWPPTPSKPQPKTVLFNASTYRCMPLETMPPL